jgi:iron(III) transport system permease protein
VIHEVIVTRWRFGLALLLLVTIGIPLVMPFFDLWRHPQGWQAWQETSRLASLATNTVQLMLGSVALSVPIGTIASVLIYRTDLPGRRFFQFLTILALFVPMPILVSAWQSALGAGGWLPIDFWIPAASSGPDVSPMGTMWKPWVQGRAAAIWIHFLAGLPWIILIVGIGLRWVERELEEEALLSVSPWRVLWHVTLPRCRTAIWAAGLWVAIQTATEISATDMMQVRTFAEEVYTQLVGGGSSAVAASVAVAAPSLIICGLIIGVAAWRLGRQLPPLENLAKSSLRFHLGMSRWPCFLGLVLAVILIIGVPLASLIWKTGLSGAPAEWSLSTFERYLLRSVESNGWIILRSLGSAIIAGGATALLAMLACWLAVESPRLQYICVIILAAAWALPGPVVGFGLKDTIQWLLDHMETSSSIGDFTARALWYGPSPLPILWIYVIRFFPFALAMLWPAVRLMPREFMESARMDGARPGQEFRQVICPLCWRPCLLAALAVTVLSLGEISASKLVETPGWDTLVHVIFDRMHYGVGNELAALCLLLLIVVLVGATIVLMVARLLANRARWNLWW